MKVEQNKVVSLSYILTVDGEMIETVPANKPMEFIMGTGYLLPKFEEHINGKSVGDSFELTLSANDSYGEVNPDAIVELPKSIFEVDGKIEDGLLEVGEILPMADADGNRMQGVIDEVLEESVIMNFNHPLAGEELHFKGTIVAVREATSDELTKGLYGEKSDGCSDDDCSTCGCGCH